MNPRTNIETRKHYFSRMPQLLRRGQPPRERQNPAVTTVAIRRTMMTLTANDIRATIMDNPPTVVTLVALAVTR